MKSKLLLNQLKKHDLCLMKATSLNNNDLPIISKIKSVYPSYNEILMFAFPYSSRFHNKSTPAGFGKVARFAQGLDYHKIIPEKIDAFIKDLETSINKKISYIVLTDATKLPEKDLAYQTNSADKGLNSLLLRNDFGSSFFVAELIWDIESGYKCEDSYQPKSVCNDCMLCKKSCPSGAILGDGTIDIKKCISYLTVEKRGVLSEEEREIIADHVFGCDICQEACYINAKSQNSYKLEFSPQSGVGPYLDLGAILKIRNNVEFREKFAGTGILRQNRAGLLRNCIIVAANTKAKHILPILKEVSKKDTSPVVREYALWAINKLNN